MRRFDGSAMVEAITLDSIYGTIPNGLTWALPLSA